MGKLKKVPVQIYLEPEQNKMIGFLSQTSRQIKGRRHPFVYFKVPGESPI